MIVIDNFIRDQELISDIKNDDNFFPKDMGSIENIGEVNNYFHVEDADCYAPYMFWDGWWKSPADTLKKRVVQEIWSKDNFLPFPLEEVCGFEYWTRTFKEGQYLRLHVDEDTFAYQKDKTFNAPAYGCVWYGFSQSDNPGFLELHEGVISGYPENALESENIDPLISPPERRERIAHRPNRLICFNAGRRLHEATPTMSGVRQVMVVNVWHKNSPPSALISGGFYYE
jgi:hypothetical protein